ncbi:MAG: spermidine synthase [Gammaproteobacteria bacterium]|nr:spermidine synthase [Gammaproteobacteria bacterium]
MQSVFEELDFQKTPYGEISLRRRSEPRLDHQIIFEVKLGDEFLMSSLFVEAEEQLATLGLAALRDNGFDRALNVVVGGLGLGYTGLQALQDKAVEKLRVIDVMQPVISWHQQGVLPIGDVLATDPKCQLLQGDFFAIACADTRGFIDDQAVHAVLLDIDHSPGHWLNQANSDFYTAKSLTKMATKIVPGGVFGLWSNELPDDSFCRHLDSIFSQVEAHIIRFDNPYSGGESTNSVYIAHI